MRILTIDLLQHYQQSIEYLNIYGYYSDPGEELTILDKDGKELEDVNMMLVKLSEIN